MHINRLRLTGFKSFVEPTELIIERGLTGVVGPNGCGKSNLLEALRWVMGESSHKSMRAAAMDDVIFSGTTTRPSRGWAEVMIAIDNSARTAPTGFNDSDTIEITRRIEREAGSAYRINGQDARARDVKVLFEDAATGARSPALVRQGQISEIVNAKPEQRRRILEDAAGIAGLHTRRHEAELRLRAAEGNLARIGDILGQLNGQIESLKRQARQAKRYKEISNEIRRSEALLFHLSWADAQAEVDTREAELSQAMSELGHAVEAEAKAVTAELRIAENLPAAREDEAKRSAILARLKMEQDNFEREAARAAERERELKSRIVQLTADVEREDASVAEARELLERLEVEQEELAAGEEAAADLGMAAAEALEEATLSLTTAEHRMAALTTAAFERRTRRRGLESGLTERQANVDRLKRQLIQIEAQVRETIGRAPDAIKLADTQAAGQRLFAEIAEIEASTEAAEAAAQAAAELANIARQDRETRQLASTTLRAERNTLAKLLLPSAEQTDLPVIDAIEVAPGYETALGAALGDDLEAALSPDAPVHWRLIAANRSDAKLPDGATTLGAHVKGPPELARRMAQIGLVERESGALLQPSLKPGQRLVSREGDIWRWDGFVAIADAPTAAGRRLAERNRLVEIDRKLNNAIAEADRTDRRAAETVAAHEKAQAHERELRQRWREAQMELVRARDAMTVIERAARETEARMSQLQSQKAEIGDAYAEALELVGEVEMALTGVADDDDDEGRIAVAQRDVEAERNKLADARARLMGLGREREMRRQRAITAASEAQRWKTRSMSAEQQLRTLTARLAETQDELAVTSIDPEALGSKRSALLSALSTAETGRQAASDNLARTEGGLRAATQALKAAQAAVVTEREARARIEARLEAARARRSEEARKIREQLSIAPDQCLVLAEIEPGTPLPALADVDRLLTRLKTDRERLGGVNLSADDELATIDDQFKTLDGERGDVEAAIAKLRGGIGQLNKEGKKRLMDAFVTVDGHFQRLFTTLFGGGEARLEMVESDDPLEGGLEIVAKPPGKKPATLSLLSGGEQTLTALSLIFAVFLTNPSPICVLDEVDAPLDDSNVDRFCTLMERMAEETETRFLVITHHPMTMARMNRLFGVTMGEKGVSQLVSVDLNTAERFLEAV